MSADPMERRVERARQLIEAMPNYAERLHPRDRSGKWRKSALARLQSGHQYGSGTPHFYAAQSASAHGELSAHIAALTPEERAATRHETSSHAAEPYRGTILKAMDAHDAPKLPKAKPPAGKQTGEKAAALIQSHQARENPEAPSAAGSSAHHEAAKAAYGNDSQAKGGIDAATKRVLAHLQDLSNEDLRKTIDQTKAHSFGHDHGNHVIVKHGEAILAKRKP